MSDDQSAEELPYPVRLARLVQHDYLCAGCAHRFHGDCAKKCPYCWRPCQCACNRWAVPLAAVEKP